MRSAEVQEWRSDLKVGTLRWSAHQLQNVSWDSTLSLREFGNVAWDRILGQRGFLLVGVTLTMVLVRKQQCTRSGIVLHETGIDAYPGVPTWVHSIPQSLLEVRVPHQLLSFSFFIFFRLSLLHCLCLPGLLQVQVCRSTFPGPLADWEVPG